MIVLEQLKHDAKTDRIALANREERMSYKKLDALSDAFAVWLLDTFGEGRSPVVLCRDEETSFLPCIFGALKARRTYVPVDSVVLENRAVQIVADVKPKLIADFTGRKLNCGVKVLTLAD